MKVRKLIGLIAVIVLGAVSIGTLFGLSRTTVNDIAGFDFKTVNEANYFKVDLYEDSFEKGSPFEIDTDGQIIVDWDENYQSNLNDVEVPIQKNIILEEGEYIFKSGVKNTSRDTYYLVLKEVDESNNPIVDGDVIYSDSSFKVTDTTTYSAFIVIAEGELCKNVTFTPILVEKGEKAKFYVYDFNPFNNED